MATMAPFYALFIFALFAISKCEEGLEAPKDVTTNMLTMDFMNLPEYESSVNMSINTGCFFNNCTLANGIEVSIVNVTVNDTPVQDEEQHWLWSVIGRPTVQAAITNPGDYSMVNWTLIFDKNDIGNSIFYANRPLYSGAVMLMNLIEYDDPDDKAVLSKSPSKSVIYPIENFRWTRRVLEDNDERIAIQFLGTNYTSVTNDTKLGGHINLTLSAYSTEGFGHWLPHLSHNTKTSQVDIQLERLNSSSGFNHSRFALEMIVVSETASDSLVARQVSTTLDDEHTPGIFKTEEMILPGNTANRTNYQSFLQWRPVVYTTRARDLSESTGVNVSQTVVVQEIDDQIKKSVLYAMYGENIRNYLVRKFNVTFGSPEDGFYKKTKYNAWTFTFGVGQPIRNGLSPIIVLVITAMIGAIIVVVVTASIVCVVKKWRKRMEQNAQYHRVM